MSPSRERSPWSGASDCNPRRRVSRRELPVTIMGTRWRLCEVGVPTVHRFGPYRFWFFSHENEATNEPEHIHVASGDGRAIFWLRPVSLRDYRRYTPREVERIRASSPRTVNSF